MGANGQVGWELRRSLSLLGTVIALHRNGDNNGNYAGNLEDPCAIEATIQTLKPQVVVNAAAYTAVDKAEHDYDKAYLINALAVAQIAKACKEVNALLVHYSTDYVFDGSTAESTQQGVSAVRKRLKPAEQLEFLMALMAIQFSDVTSVYDILGDPTMTDEINYFIIGKKIDGLNYYQVLELAKSSPTKVGVSSK